VGRQQQMLSRRRAGRADANSLVGRRRALQQRLEELAAEIEEREQFMSSMQQLGPARRTACGHCQRGISAQVKELGQLDQQISQLDRQVGSSTQWASKTTCRMFDTIKCNYHSRNKKEVGSEVVVKLMTAIGSCKCSCEARFLDGF